MRLKKWCLIQVLYYSMNKIIPRIPHELLPKAFAYRLSKSDCNCRGFILEGFPKTFEDARLLFETPNQHLKEKSPDNSHVEVQKASFFPQHIVSFEGTDETLLKRGKGPIPEPDNEEAKTLFTKREERIVRRLPIYRKQNVDSNTALHYFESKGVESMKLDVSEKTPEDIIVSVKHFLTRLESPVTLINETDEFLKWRNTKAALLSFQNEENRKTRILESQLAEEEEQRSLLEKEEKAKLEKIMEAEKELLDIRSQSLRQYLVDNLIPYLMKGLIEVCRVMPEDPIQMLIDILEKTADELIEAGEV